MYIVADYFGPATTYFMFFFLEVKVDRFFLRVLIYAFITLNLSIAHAEPQTLWVYTSIYKEYASELEKAFEHKFPQVDVQIFQAGSEKLQSKIEAEILSHKPVADVVMVSDPVWARDLDKRGLIALRKGHKSFEDNYYSAMVLIVHNKLPKEKRPTSFFDLTKTDFKNQIQMGNPLESGTTFTTVSLLSKKFGWDFFKKLKANQMASNGGNSTVIQKVETAEKKVGIVLLENALAAIKRGSPIEIIYPQDGAILIPSVQVIMKNSAHQEFAGQFADFVTSKEGQEILRTGYMYSIRKDIKAPEGAMDFSELAKKAQQLSEAQMKEVAIQAKTIKKTFSELILE
jgi:iron(III) transport system substrate-binding protein